MFHQTWQLRTSQWIVALLAALLIATGVSWTAQAASTADTYCVQTHTVQRGENLYRIALRYNTNFRTLQQWNNISNPNRIYVGQKLCVKMASAPTPTPAPAPTVPEAKPTNVQYVTALEAVRVRRGPGLQHAIVGGLIKGQTATVTGISPDGNWWQVLCPSSATTNTCWVTASPSLTRPVYPEPGQNTSTAIIESVSVQVRESYPLQIVAVVRGYLPDGCTYIDRFRQLREGRSIRIQLITGRNPGFCTQALVPFEQVIHLDTAGWHAGIYSVVADNARADFYLP